MDWLKEIFGQLRINLYSRVSKAAKRRTEQNKLSVRSTIVGVQIGNFLIAISTTGLMALGALPMSLTLLITLAIVFIIVGIFGRYVDAVEDDVERLLKYEQYISKGTDGSNTNTPSPSSVQQQSD